MGKKNKKAKGDKSSESTPREAPAAPSGAAAQSTTTPAGPSGSVQSPGEKSGGDGGREEFQGGRGRGRGRGAHPGESGERAVGYGRGEGRGGFGRGEGRGGFGRGEGRGGFGRMEMRDIGGAGDAERGVSVDRDAGMQRSEGRAENIAAGDARPSAWGRAPPPRASPPESTASSISPATSSPASSRGVTPASDAPQSSVSSQPQSPVRSQPPTTTALEKLSLKHTGAGLQPPVRKSVGKAGQAYFVETNHLPLTINVKEIVHYDVAISPDKPKRFLRYVMDKVRTKHYHNRFPAFDGNKNLYSSGPLPFGAEFSTEVTLHDEERMKELTFKVEIKYATRIDTSVLSTYMRNGASTKIPQQAIQAIDVILRAAPSLRFTPVGRSYFTPPTSRSISLGDGMELWYGVYQSAILGWKPFVNVDVAHKGFPEPRRCLNLMEEFQIDINNPGFEDIKYLEKFLKGLKVDYEIPGVANTKRTYKVNGLKSCSRDIRFKHEDREMTVMDYYAKVKGYRLQYPHLPCLHLGSIQREMYMPIELCQVSKGQSVNRKLNEKQTAAMIKVAATPAYVRKNKIMESVSKAGFSHDPSLKEFGLVVGENFTKVPARILEPPMLDGTGTRVNKGVWRPGRFCEVGNLNNWTILNMDNRTRRDSIERFVGDMIRVGSDLGMRIVPPNIIDDRNIRNKYDFLNPKMNQSTEIVVVIIPDMKGVYERVKKTAELQYGVLTQCVKASTVYRMKPATVSNILLKINAKLNGRNHSIRNSLEMFKRPIMVVGADVTHPSPDATGIPSAAAVAASMDRFAFKYSVEFRIQPPRAEIIEDLVNIMKEHLMKFYRLNNKAKPERIVMFRDGVSDGQFAVVLQEEMMAIRKACSQLEPNYKPKITFLVVQKRHHTRFFPPQGYEDGKNGNVCAGTIVDQEITHPRELDFYLVSHASIQGTSRPTKYHLLWDDSDFSTDEIQALTYHLCHMFSRCTRSVSYPAPTYYAHLGAFRARAYIDEGTINLNNLPKEQARMKLHDTIVKNYPMFFV